MHDTHALYLSVIIPNISIGIQNRVTMIKEGQGGAKRFPDRQIMTGSAAGFFWAKGSVVLCVACVGGMARLVAVVAVVEVNPFQTRHSGLGL